MSKNNKDDLTRIRDNQRRSRNRRKELIQDLQNQVHQFQLKGVSATQEMQRAARKVALENTRLRDLLGQHGVSRAKIEDYLRACEALGETAAMQNAKRGGVEKPCGERQAHDTTQYPSVIEHGQVDLQPYSTRNPRLEQDQDHDQDRNSNISRPTTDTPDPFATMPIYSHTTHSHLDPHLSTPILSKCCNPAPTVNIIEDLDCPNTTDCFCPPTLPASNLPPSSSLEISCETAATIIAQMRGDGDRDAARASLGCSRGEECNIKSSTIMQIMDER